MAAEIKNRYICITVHFAQYKCITKTYKYDPKLSILHGFKDGVKVSVMSFNCHVIGWSVKQVKQIVLPYMRILCVIIGFITFAVVHQ